jgi:hypothetical protein
MIPSVKWQMFCGKQHNVPPPQKKILHRRSPRITLPVPPFHKLIKPDRAQLCNAVFITAQRWIFAFDMLLINKLIK